MNKILIESDCMLKKNWIYNLQKHVEYKII